ATSKPPRKGVDVEVIKRLAIRAMFSDDVLMRYLVLKGGNALDLVYQISTRASVDIDFSISNDFPGGIDGFRSRVEKALSDTFARDGYHVFDVRMSESPEEVSAELRDFWGGYDIEFKLIKRELYEVHARNLETLRRHALDLGGGPKFSIDVRRFEYTEGKQHHDFDGYRIFVYSRQMMICEKLRAICQQLPEYGPIVKRRRPGSPRARDFVDIHALATSLEAEFLDSEFIELLEKIFAAKHVPLAFLDLINNHRDFHAQEFPSVRDTVKAGVSLRDFDFYFDFVVELARRIRIL
ncbi:MAG: nucleotidyl transferase AbiEii/AbiGii toxin family protein, partial [Candidatus Binatia bacterium]